MSDEIKNVLRLPPKPACVGIARSVIRSLASVVDAEPLGRAELVISEIVTNSIRHGSRDGSEDVEVDITADGSQLVVVVTDRGPKFEPPIATPGTAQIGGFGLFIARKLADLTITRADAGNAVRFAIPCG